MPRPQTTNPETSPAARFGYELRRLRMEVRMTQSQLGRRLGYTGAAMGAIERGLRLPQQRELVEQCDEALGVNGALLQIWEQCRSDGNQRWFYEWLEVEQQALTLRTWQPTLVPGLLQTPDYARTMLAGRPGASSDDVERAVEARLDRQAILTRERPPMIWAVLDEMVLQRPIGGAAVMEGQLNHLLAIAEHPRITLQIVPLDAGCTAALRAGFIIAQIRDGRDIVYLDTAGKGQVTAHSKEVRNIQLRYEAVRTSALAQNASLSLVREWMQKWST
ncbi:XRE family transcriptional regulator [Sphaerisporangium album]|uniref:XRE family transcriptional regulator n=1 Tax=Sphaerisporangium album TaxID=509200 RepID=A0A367FC17_9ACTN|nr:helix-turn-helix transcriptional regulator [Sphaerisporangium album]RCG27916.1 XRE family transcriptional regulator [Sphaerisporangium album]